MSATVGMESAVRKGLAWSTVNNLVLRLGGLTLGIILARILQPEQFGVYAIALTVQAILMTLADLGLSADLIRSDQPERIGPTVATLGLVSGLVLSGTMAVTAPMVAQLMGSAQSSGVIAALSLTLLLAGLGVVPYAKLNREFAQHKLFIIAMMDFAVSTGVTLALIFAGWGVMSLAVGRIVAQTGTLIMQYVFAGQRPHFGWERIHVRPVMAFGLPVAAANLLSWALLNIDNVAVSRMAGPLSLGFYVLAFNISSWPMNALGQAVRSVALPAFAKISDKSDKEGPNGAFQSALALTWAVSLPAGVLLAVVAGPAITLLYGHEWDPAVPVLQALGLFGAMRATFDLAASYLTAKGATGNVLWVQVAWFVVLVPAMVIGVKYFGLVGAGWSHVVVGVAVAGFYTWALKRQGLRLLPLWHALWPPLLAAIPAAVAAYFAGNSQSSALAGTLLGGLAGTAVYGLLIIKWVVPRVRVLRTVPQTDLPGREATGQEIAEQESAGIGLNTMKGLA